MDWIINSKLFKGSKRQDKILAAINDPINQPLMKQLESYVNPDYAEEQNKLKDSSVENVEDIVDKTDKKIEDVKDAGDSSLKPNDSSGPHFSYPSSKKNSSHENAESSDFESESSDNIEDKSENIEDTEVEESTKIDSKPIQASSLITIENVSQAVNEIPGMLNLREDTCGVSYCTLKSNNSELWIYYLKDVDINKVLVNISLAIAESGYSFLVFDRVSRDDNAVIMTVNWISSYQPLNNIKMEVESEG